MTRLRWSLVACFAAALLIAPALRGQQQAQNAPHVGYVYPAGGQQGTTFQVKVGGRFLDGVNQVVVSGRGVHAQVVSHDKPLIGQQLTELRDKLQELQKQLGNTPAFQKEAAATRMRIGDSQRRNANPVLGEIVTLQVTMDADAEPGSRALRLATPFGLTNPLVFCVGQVPEFREIDEKRSKADAELPITLPAVVNGRMIPGDVDRLQFPVRQAQQYAPGDVDRYRFQARKGQDLVFAVSARELMPYLADAVPGWFQATLALYDANGKELAYEDDFRFQPDPVLHYQIPADGEYVAEIKDALYRGREDFVYRITIGELPFVTSIFPLGGRTGSKTNVELTGWNLAANTSTMDTTRVEPGIFPLIVRAGKTMANRVPFAVDTLPELVEHEGNDAPKDAQRLKLPVIVNGRIQAPGDWDVFSFQGRAGEAVVAEVFARRLSSPLDSVLELTDAAGKRLAFNDDREDKAFGLITHHADSLITATLPATGTYYLRLGDRQRKGGPEYGYRLRVAPPQPDFQLRVAPSSIVAVGNASVAVTVYAFRKDGFAGDIALDLKGAPGGFVLSGGLIPAGQDQMRLTLTAPAVATKEPISVRVEGRATIERKTVVRQAVPAEDMMQAFAYRHLVPADDLRVSVSGRGATRVPSLVVSAQPVKIPAGGSARVSVTMPPGYRAFEKIQFELSEPPDGITLRDTAIDQFGQQVGGQFVLQADAAKVKPGARGNLIVTVSGERAPNPQAPNAQGAVRRRVPMTTLPAIQFEITPPKWGRE
jgi:hypothetical protein